MRDPLPAPKPALPRKAQPRKPRTRPVPPRGAPRRPGPPPIATARLAMGAATDADVEAFIAFCGTPRSRFIGGPSGRDDAWRSVAVHLGHWPLRGFGTWWLTDRASGRPAGRVGLWQPDGHPEPELSWVLYAGFEGQGLACEAATAARDWAYGTLGLRTLVSLVEAENFRSVRLAERMGARPDGTWTHGHGGSVMIWRHPAPQEPAA